jgi:hypothetical protein
MKRAAPAGNQVLKVFRRLQTPCFAPPAVILRATRMCHAIV